MNNKTVALDDSGDHRAQPLALAKLTLDPRLQPRQHMDDDVLREYADAMRRGESFPPIRVITDQDHHYLVDGWHRVKAAQHVKRTTLEAQITAGTFEKAEDYVLTVNRTHGLRRTHADVQNAIRRALLTKRWANRADSWIARHIGCSDKTVTAMREELESTSEIPKLKHLFGQDGKPRARAKPKSKPAPKPVPKPINDPPPTPRPSVGTQAKTQGIAAIPLAKGPNRVTRVESADGWTTYGPPEEDLATSRIRGALDAAVHDCRLFARLAREARMQDHLLMQLELSWDEFCLQRLGHPVEVVEAMLALGRELEGREKDDNVGVPS